MSILHHILYHPTIRPIPCGQASSRLVAIGPNNSRLDRFPAIERTQRSSWTVAALGWISVILFLGSAIAQGEEWEVSRLDGGVERTEAIVIRANELAYTFQGEKVVRPWNELSRVRKVGVTTSLPKQVLHIVDGSTVAWTKLEGKNDRWQLSGSWGNLELGKNQTSWLQFRPPVLNEPTTWNEIASSKMDTDILVISRGEGVLDRAQGMILEITPSTVKFDYDGQILDAPLSKLLGVLWLRNSGNRIEPSVRVGCIDGSQWMAKELRWADSTMSPLQMTGAGGYKLDLDPSQLLEIDFSIANLTWLSTLTPVEAHSEKRVVFKNPLPIRDTAFLPRFQSRQENGAPQDQDLLFMSPGDITFRVPAGIKRLMSTVVRTSLGDVRSALVIEVWENENKIFESVMAPEQNESLVQCDVQVDKRIKLVVRSQSSLMAGCEVKWLQPRFLR